MRSVIGRLAAVVLLAGQLQGLPAALGCVQEHSRATAPHCDEGAAPGSPVAQAAQSGGLCTVVGPCAITGSAGVPSAPTIAFASDVVTQQAPAAFAAPASLALSPTPPPPQA
jgi:hypothetical protein